MELTISNSAALASNSVENATPSKSGKTPTFPPQFFALKKALLALHFLAFCLAANAQSPAWQPLHRSYTSEQGLPSNMITEVLQDRQGYIWLATGNGIAAAKQGRPVSSLNYFLIN